MRSLTLTFDNGPEPDVTPRVLDILRERGIRTTFFVIGEKLADPERRALAERAFDEGHWIGNHTYTHSKPLGLLPGPGVAEAEIGRTQDLIGELSHPDRLFRPYGNGGIISRALLSPSVVEHLVEGGYSCVLWKAIPRDWSDPDGWVDRALSQCEEQGRTVMVLHDLPSGAMAHLPRFLDGLAARGIAIRQDIPPEMMPIRRGRITQPIADYISDAPSECSA
ncbi:polysaccharide deacetylase family protein [Enterovirga rhinocerotis]|uniref:Chitooligosaccharide deacetylase n=1 Tax=Enterovirga rhinocerotis TaxID=1339210 RepID=A0A4V3DXX5_9HYPH|nr:polysaccharide deacetylase family protein [Enterovirga rhinocerotis]TDR90429.1 peptidoglycan/xylan/chitin deacetylase (PgdA/CDA1 family) [Enterovirga rhinocerotis]